MKGILTQFINGLRRRGVRVSPDENMDALKGLYYVGLSDRQACKSVLQMTLIKNEKDLDTFDTWFDQYFKVLWNIVEAQPELPSEAVREVAIAMKHLAEGEKQPEGGEHSGFKIMIQTEELEDVEVSLDDLELIEQELGIGSGIGLSTNLHLGESLQSPNPEGTYSTGELKYFVDEEQMEQWKRKNFNEYTEEEISKMDEMVIQMVNRLKKDIKKLRKKKNDGKLHVTKTLRRNSRFGMIPFEPHFKKRNKEKPRIVVLCDVSYSVSYASRFLLHLMHSLQNTILSVRSFVFVKELIEVTELLNKYDVHQSMNKISLGEVVDVDENSDYGHALLTFQKNFIDSMKGQPAVIFLGDARNNYNKSNAWVLEEVKEKSVFTMWLTPERKGNWDLGDCVIKEYGEHVDAIEVVKNVEDLSRVVEKLIRNMYRGGRNIDWEQEGEPESESDFGMAIFRNSVTISNEYEKMAQERLAARK
jgi:hypothetical protein